MQGDASLHIAVHDGKLAVAECLLSHKANCELENQQGHTPLEMAITKQQPDCAKLMLAYHCNVRQYTIDLARQVRARKDIMDYLQLIYQVIQGFRVSHRLHEPCVYGCLDLSGALPSLTCAPPS